MRLAVLLAFLISAVAVAPSGATTVTRRPVLCLGVPVRSTVVRLGRVVVVARRRATARDACRRAPRVVRGFFTRVPKGIVRRTSVLGWRCAGRRGVMTCVRGGARLLAVWSARQRAPGTGRGLGGDIVSDPTAGGFTEGEGPGRWYSDTVPYYDATTDLQAEVARAVEAWNTSGVRIRWVAVPRDRARVIMSEEEPDSGAEGSAPRPLEGQRLERGVIKLSPRLAHETDEGWPPPTAAQIVVEVVTHEMGHVLGLDHQDDVCATMNSLVWGSCATQPRWRYYCRALQAPDIARAVRIYGGTSARLGPELCVIGPPPAAVTGLAATPTEAGGPVHLSWTTPGDPAIQTVHVIYKQDSCPESPDDPAAGVYGDLPPTPGEQSADLPVSITGRYCAAVYTVAAYEQPSAPATTLFDYVAPG